MIERGLKPTLKDLKSALKRKGFTPSKALGQNFLYEHQVLEAIAMEINPAQTGVLLEIGCGSGFLTMHLADTAGKILAVEIDQVLVTVAKRFLSEYPNVEVLEADILKNGEISPAVLKRLEELGGCGLVAGNLPYSAATAIVSALAHWKFTPEALVFMLQEEVARRLAAEPGSPDYGALSVITQAAFEVELLREIGPEVFWPKPKVDSRLLKLTPVKFDGDLRQFEAFVHALFAQPRKTALNSLVMGAGRVDLPFVVKDTAGLREKVAGLFRLFGIDPAVRPGRLDLSQIRKLFDNLCRNL
jgi:16S rRNA (adenine1518-N6/adenine1519-N6)-dimethyltransferase